MAISTRTFFHWVFLLIIIFLFLLLIKESNLDELIISRDVSLAEERSRVGCLLLYLDYLGVVNTVVLDVLVEVGLAINFFSLGSLYVLGGVELVPA